MGRLRLGAGASKVLSRFLLTFCLLRLVGEGATLEGGGRSEGVEDTVGGVLRG